MSDRDILIVLILMFCTGLSFLFSGMESGVMALNRFRIRQLARTGNRRAVALRDYLEHPEDFLWTILVGNTVVNVVIFSVGSYQLRDWLGGNPLLWLLAFVPLIFLFYIACELLPKTLFQRYPNRLSLILARPFRFIHRGLSPLVAVAAWFSGGLLRWTGGTARTGRLFGSREELRFVMQEAAPSLTSEEKTMINRVLDLQNLRVRHVAVPMAVVTSIPASMPMSEALVVCRENSRTRLPVLDTKSGRVAGILNLDHALYLDDLDTAKPARDYMQPALFLPEELRVEEALQKMQHTGWRLAIVLGPDQQETGILTLQDILRMIFGEVSL